MANNQNDQKAAENAALQKQLDELKAENAQLKAAAPVTATQLLANSSAQRKAREALAAEAMAKQQKAADEQLAKAIAGAPRVTNLSQTLLRIAGVDVGIGDTQPVPDYKETKVLKLLIDRGVIKVESK